LAGTSGNPLERTTSGSLSIPGNFGNKSVAEIWESIEAEKQANPTARSLKTKKSAQPYLSLNQITFSTFMDRVGIELEPTISNLVPQESLVPPVAVLAQKPPRRQASKDKAKATAAAKTKAAAIKDAVPPPQPKKRGRKPKLDVDQAEKERKIEARKAKNRESAARSRDRKQEYTESLEVKLENAQKEIEKLKKRLSKYEDVEGLEDSERPKKRSKS